MPQDTESRSLDKVIVRLPDGMRDNIARVAKRNGRSMNAEIVAVLEERFPSADKLRKTIEELEGFLDFLPQDQRQPLKDQIDKLNRDFYAAHGGVFE